MPFLPDPCEPLGLDRVGGLKRDSRIGRIEPMSQSRRVASAAALEQIAKSRAVIETLAHAETPHYGVSTGFGALATRHIPPELRAQLQRSLIRSHAAGSGPEVEAEVVRALTLLRLSTLATGRTGVRVETAQAYAGLLNAQLAPVVHEYGSLGCSGDLAPLSHVALAVMGEGQIGVGCGSTCTNSEAGSCAGAGEKGCWWQCIQAIFRGSVGRCLSWFPR